jgi:hypothetical protein
MSVERDFKKEGEVLAKVAVDGGMGAKQLQTIYRLVKTKPMAYVEAYVQRQIGRGIRGYDAFLMLLDLIKKYVEDKGAFEKVLMYANMLYVYYEHEATMKLKISVEAIVKGIVERRRFRYDGLSMESRGRFMEIRVGVKSFHGNPKALAMEIDRALKERVSELSKMKLRIWIEST